MMSPTDPGTFGDSPEMTPAKPVPVPDSVSLPYWQAAKQRRLVVQQCSRCGLFQYPPDIACRYCQSEELQFTDVGGRGVVYSFATYVRSFMAGFDAPYVLALIDLEDHPEVRIMTNLVDTPLESIEIGLPVEVTFEDRGEWVVPQFRGTEVRSS